MKYSESPQQFTATVDDTIAFYRGEVEGYTNTPSVQAGQSIELKVSTLAAYNPSTGTITPVPCSMSIYRVTAVSATNDQLVASGYTFNATFYPLHDKTGAAIYPGQTNRFPCEYRKGCNWATTYTLSIPSNWVSGFYYAKIISNSDPVRVGYIPFVVKKASPSSNILCVIAWNTYHAYNYWGGGSLYWWLGTFESPDITQGGGPYIKKVSFRRPFTNFISGGLPVTTQLGQLDAGGKERNFIAWAESNNYPMDFCVDADLNGDSLQVQNYKLIIFPGHSEYWSLRQRNKIENIFKTSGGNLTFHCSNNCYWKVDYYPPQTDNPDSMQCEKDNNAAFWRVQPLINGVGGPEAKFIGVQFYGVNIIQIDSVTIQGR
ncbi:MAG TPA: N,N-dimethylformamidase beta subunit family domain-containing protein, partial [Candidatus Nitrosotenuis sp.]|nr:N,N-dimethylformamidase beta subunit family domain-containing protein [Candidatus Nitrosotenuis sp.]